MADPFLGQILIVGFNFAPVGWATCDGQLLPISQNTALFSLLGTTYGGNGVNTFALPNLMDRTPIGFGQGPGLSPYGLGEQGGADSVTVLTSELPPHGHALNADTTVSPSGTPTSSEVFGTSKAAKPGTVNVYGPADANNMAAFDPGSVSPAGGGQPHNNRQPYLGLLFVIAMLGIFPTRN